MEWKIANMTVHLYSLEEENARLIWRVRKLGCSTHGDDGSYRTDDGSDGGDNGGDSADDGRRCQHRRSSWWLLIERYHTALESSA